MWNKSIISVADAVIARTGKCGACKHYEGKKTCCPAFPVGIPQLTLDSNGKSSPPCIHWADALKKKELADLMLLLSDTKKGAEFRITLAVKEGETPDPRDVEMLNNKQGRPKKDTLEEAFTEADIMEDYGELRAHGVKYEDACEIVVYLQNFCAENQGRREIGVKHIRAIVTKWTNWAKDSHFDCQDKTDENAAEQWEMFIKKQKAYLRECKDFWGGKLFSKG